jgi:hypothetical protein
MHTHQDPCPLCRAGAVTVQVVDGGQRVLTAGVKVTVDLESCTGGTGAGLAMGDSNDIGPKEVMSDSRGTAVFESLRVMLTTEADKRRNATVQCRLSFTVPNNDAAPARGTSAYFAVSLIGSIIVRSGTQPRTTGLSVDSLITPSGNGPVFVEIRGVTNSLLTLSQRLVYAQLNQLNSTNVTELGCGLEDDRLTNTLCTRRRAVNGVANFTTLSTVLATPTGRPHSVRMSLPAAYLQVSVNTVAFTVAGSTPLSLTLDSLRPAPAMAGQTITVVVQALDRFGNRVGYTTSSPVTIDFTNAITTPTVTSTSKGNGLFEATFAITEPSNTYRALARISELAMPSPYEFSVVYGPVAVVAVTSQPSKAQQMQVLSGQPQIRLRDAYNNNMEDPGTVSIYAVTSDCGSVCTPQPFLASTSPSSRCNVATRICTFNTTASVFVASGLYFTRSGAYRLVFEVSAVTRGVNGTGRITSEEVLIAPVLALTTRRYNNQSTWDSGNISTSSAGTALQQSGRLGILVTLFNNLTDQVRVKNVCVVYVHFSVFLFDS